MEDQRSTYNYIPLNDSKNEIRLLHIIPKSAGRTDVNAPHSTIQNVKTVIGDIQCRLSLASLDDPIVFEALSYVWGDPKVVRRIDLDGHDFQVTENLYSALNHIRTDEERVIWVDALCINQADNLERTSQVAQMRHIFGLASTVVVFLGEAWEGSDAVLDIVEQMGANQEVHIHSALDRVFTASGNNLDDHALVHAVTKFVTLPWFSRIWTVQEYVLARQAIFQCGRRPFNGDLIFDFLRHFLGHIATCCDGWTKRLSEDPDSLLNLETICTSARDALDLGQIRYRRSDMTLEYCILFTRYRECFDPRDKIYGILGLAAEVPQELIHPNYDSSTAKVYTDLVMTLVQETQKLDVLSGVYGEGRLDLGLPSFVPDWTTIIPPTWQGALQSRDRVLHTGVYNACGGSQTNLELLDGSRGACQAIIIDKIADIDEYNASGITHPDIMQRDLARILDTITTPYHCKETALWQTLCGEIIATVYDAGPICRKVEDTDFLAYQQWQKGTPEPSGTLSFSASARFGLSFDIVTIGRRLILTHKGYVGFGPFDCEKGDLVVIMPGGRVPYILRPILGIHASEKDDNVSYKDGNSISTPSRQFAFLGDAYVHGIMHGEAYDEKNLEPIILV